MENQTEPLALEFKGVPELGPHTEEFLTWVKASTSRTYRSSLSLFAKFLCARGEGSVDSFIQRVDDDNQRPLALKVDYAAHLLRQFNQSLVNLGKAPKSTRCYLASVQGLAKYRRVSLTLDYLGMPKDDVQVLTHEWESADEVARFLKLFTFPTYQALGRLMFQSALSVGDCLSLTYSDVQKELGKGVSPLLLDFRREGRSKTGVKFCTFAGRWTVEGLQDLLKGRVMYPDSKLFETQVEAVDSYFKSRATEFLGGWEGKTNPCSPHSLRHGWRSIVHMARVITETDIEALMGHGKKGKAKMENTYMNINVEAWRQIWKRCELCLTPSYLQKQYSLS
jgi:integrase